MAKKNTVAGVERSAAVLEGLDLGLSSELRSTMWACREDLFRDIEAIEARLSPLLRLGRREEILMRRDQKILVLMSAYIKAINTIVLEGRSLSYKAVALQYAYDTNTKPKTRQAIQWALARWSKMTNCDPIIRERSKTIVSLFRR